MAEREAQIRAYYGILEAKRARKDDELWSIADVFMKHFCNEKDSSRSPWQHSNVSGRLDYFEVLETMRIAIDKTKTPGRGLNSAGTKLPAPIKAHSRNLAR